jgi:polyhydroxyalkanoate synthase
VAEPARGDKRFQEPAWSEEPLLDLVKQWHLLAERHADALVSQVGGLDAHSTRKLAFYTRQIMHALAPTNTALNPKVRDAALKSGGLSLLQGLSKLLDDLERGKGRLALTMTDYDAFVPGENIAATPGHVVYQNELMQLLRYTPTTDKVHRRPLLIVPPWVNKYYILDMRPDNSFIRWAVGEGHTVFVISWINPDESLQHKAFEDYMLEGPLAALDAIGQQTGEKDVNAIGYCIGGTLLASTLAYMAAKRDRRIASATFFTCLLDFTDVGELSVFIDEPQIQLMEDHMRRKGYFDGSHMANAFNLLRENDLIWSFFVQNYLLGEDPRAFDLLYWNSDSTRMPTAMHSFYLRNMYQHNRLREPGGITLAGVPIDLRQIETPAYFLSTREDHIAPWTSTYAGAQLLGGPVRFVLGGSGHIAGVINPPAARKYMHWTSDELPADPEQWLGHATEHPGSWWPHWAEWVSQYSGGAVSARRPKARHVDPIEAAPGSYMKMRIA